MHSLFPHLRPSGVFYLFPVLVKLLQFVAAYQLYLLLQCGHLGGEDQHCLKQRFRADHAIILLQFRISEIREYDRCGTKPQHIK